MTCALLPRKLRTKLTSFPTSQLSLQDALEHRLRANEFSKNSDLQGALREYHAVLFKFKGASELVSCWEGGRVRSGSAEGADARSPHCVEMYRVAYGRIGATGGLPVELKARRS